jgi:hypothetical protein
MIMIRKGMKRDNIRASVQHREEEEEKEEEEEEEEKR